MHLSVGRDQGVTTGQDQKIGHAFQLCPGNGDFAVAGPGKETGKADGRAISGDDTEWKTGWTEPVG